MNRARQAIELLYHDVCTVIEKQGVKNPTTHVTEQKEVQVIVNQPCRLSFQTVTSTDVENMASQTQVVKLFIAPELDIKAGSKIVVTHRGRTTAYKQSGFPAVHSNHQEIVLQLFDKWA